MQIANLVFDAAVDRGKSFTVFGAFVPGSKTLDLEALRADKDFQEVPQTSHAQANGLLRLAEHADVQAGTAGPGG